MPALAWPAEVNGKAVLKNSPWVIEESTLRASLRLESVSLLNDVQATAPAVPHLRPTDLLQLQAGESVRGEAFLIIGRSRATLWAPFSAVIEAGPNGGTFRRGPTMDTEIVLFVNANHIKDQGWRHG